VEYRMKDSGNQRRVWSGFSPPQAALVAPRRKSVSEPRNTR